MGDWKPGETCFIPATTEGILWQGTDLDDGKFGGFVPCKVIGPTLDVPDCFDLEDCRPPMSPGGNAGWGAIPERLMYAEIPKGYGELTE